MPDADPRPPAPPPSIRLADALLRLTAGARTAHPDDVSRLVGDAAAALGAHDLQLFLADYSQRQLAPLGDGDEPLDVDATLAGRAFRSGTPAVGASPDPAGRRQVWLPLLDGADRLGVLRASLPDGPGDDDLAALQTLADVVTLLVITKRQYGDGMQRTSRRRRLELAAELRWAMLPPLSFASPAVAVAGILEPAYEIAGDTFDYAVNGRTVHLAILDAMGHGLEASRMANLAVTTYRQARRDDLGLTEMLRRVDEVISDQFGPERFVTGQLATLDLDTGSVELLNAGHPLPILLRGGQPHQVEGASGLPLGLGEVTGTTAMVHLEPGDAVLFLTDGVIEARSPDGELFGTERLVDLLVKADASGLPPAEIVRRVCHAVVDHEAAHLRDDATLLLARWHGANGTSDTGAPA